MKTWSAPAHTSCISVPQVDKSVMQIAVGSQPVGLNSVRFCSRNKKSWSCSQHDKGQKTAPCPFSQSLTEVASSDVTEEGDFIYIYLSLHCHHQTDSCIKMGSDESHIHGEPLMVREKVTRHCRQTTTFEEKGELKRNRDETLLLTGLTTTYHEAKPAHSVEQLGIFPPFPAFLASFCHE